MRRALLVPYALLLVITLGLGACGVAASDYIKDEGDAAAGRPGPISPDPLIPPKPDGARQPDELVTNLLQAAAGGGAKANERVKEYLTDVAFASWADPPNVENAPVSLIRVVSGPSVSAPVVDRGTPVTVQYQPVGVLNDRGRVDVLASPETESLTFWVDEPDEQLHLRIREIEGWPAGQLLLSDQGLSTYYRIQPIYFWDKANTALVPDLRYVPLTSDLTTRAYLRLTWLTVEPSPSLFGTVRSLPAGMGPDLVRTDDGAFKISLSEAASAEAADPEAAKRLIFQLRWSLADGDAAARIDLWIAGEQVNVEVSDADLRDSLHTRFFVDGPQEYDIVDGVVGSLGPSQPSLLSVAENTGVASAAIRRDPEAVALVRDEGFGPRSLQIVTEGQSRRVDLPLSANSSLGRPSFVPGTDVVLVPTGGPDGHLLAISLVDLAISEATGNRLLGVSAAAVSPDGRRIALIAGGALYIAPLSIADGTVTVGTNAPPLLADQLAATAVTWTSESWLLVAGTRGADEQPALWRITADGVRAHDLSASLGNLQVADLTCWPDWRNSQDGDVAVRVVTDVGVYTFRNRLLDPVSRAAPFFG